MNKIVPDVMEEMTEWQINKTGVSYFSAKCWEERGALWVKITTREHSNPHVVLPTAGLFSLHHAACPK